MCCYRSRLVFGCSFEDSDISHGSVATHLRCDGIFSNSVITDFLLILIMKKIFVNWSIFDEVKRSTIKCAKLCLGHPVVFHMSDTVLTAAIRGVFLYQFLHFILYIL